MARSRKRIEKKLELFYYKFHLLSKTKKCCPFGRITMMGMHVNPRGVGGMLASHKLANETWTKT